MEPECPYCGKPVAGTGETHIGQVVHGDAIADRMIFGGGFSAIVAEMSDAQLIADQANYQRAHTIQKGLLAFPTFATLGVWLFLIAKIPAYLRANPPPPEIGTSGMSMMLMLFSGVFVWTLWRMQFKDWARRKALACAELKNRLAIIDAEIAYRAAANPMPLRQRFRLWLEQAHRPRR